MAYSSYSSSMYERKLKIDEFTGIDQSRGVNSSDYGSSPSSKNFICRYGRLYTCSGVQQKGSTIFPESSVPAENGRLFQGFFRDANGNEFSKIIISLHGRFYIANADGSDWNSWIDGNHMIAAGLEGHDWSAVNYRDEEHDWIIFTNGVDRSCYWDGIKEAVFPLNPVQGKVIEYPEPEEEEPSEGDEGGSDSGDEGVATASTTSGGIVVSEGEELFFSQITLLNERLWGGVSPKYPDRIYWSNSFDAEDWEFNYVDSTNVGGGFADVATFDGTRIRALVSAFDDVLIFKDKSMHRLSGTYPGEFALTQVYGTEGTLAPRTIVYNGTRLFFLSCEGLCVYDGTSVYSLAERGERKLRGIWSRINPSTIHTACAVMKDSVIYLAVPLDGSVINTHVIEYDVSTGVYSIIELPGVDDWLLLRDGQKETLIYINGNRIFEYGVGYTFGGEPIESSWISPEITCGSLSSKKSTGRIYMTIDCQSIDINKDPAIKLTMQSDKRVREKLIPLRNGLNRIRKRVKIRGRSFQFKIENVDGNPMSINGGMEIRIEEDFD